MISGAQQIPPDPIRGVLHQIYLANGGDADLCAEDATTFYQQMDPMFKNLLANLGNPLLQRSFLEDRFRKWMFGHPDSAHYRRQSQQNEAETIRKEIAESLFAPSFHQVWTCFKNTYFEILDEIDCLLLSKDAAVTPNTLRQIMSAALRATTLIGALESALKDNLIPDNAQRFRDTQRGEGEIMLGECKLIAEIKNAIRILLASDPSQVSPMQGTRPNLPNAIYKVRSTLIRANNPLSSAQIVYGYTNGRRIGVNVTILGGEQLPDIRPVHPYWTRELIRSIVAIGSRLGTNQNPVNIELMWTDRPTRGIFVTTAARDRMFDDPAWDSEVAELQKKLGIIYGVKFAKRADGTPVTFFPVEIGQPATGDIAKGGPRSRREDPRHTQAGRPGSRLRRPFRAAIARVRRSLTRTA